MSMYSSNWRSFKPSLSRLLHVMLLSFGMISSSFAEQYEMYTSNLAVVPGSGTSNPTLFSFAGPGLFGGLGSAFGGTASVAALEMQGSFIVDMNLDASNSGPVYFSGGTLTPTGVPGFSGTSSLGLVPRYDWTLSNPVINISSFYTTLTNGAGSASMSVALVGGTMTQTFTGGIFTPPLVIDFAATPMVASQMFSVFGDDDNGGSDTGIPDGSSHDENIGGIYGINLSDTDGAELVIFNFLANPLSFPITFPGATGPVVFTASLSTSISVPEAPVSLLCGLAGVAVIGVSNVTRMWRRRASE